MINGDNTLFRSMSKRSRSEALVADAVKEFELNEVAGWNESEIKHLDLDTALALKIPANKAARLCCRLRSIREEEAKRTPLNEQLRAAARKGVEVNHGYLWSTSTSLVEEVDRLIRAGAEVDSSDDLGDTALHISCQKNHPEIVERLLRGGASVNATNVAGSKPKVYPTRRTLLLRRLGLTVHAQVDGFRPLHSVAVDGPLSTITALLANKKIDVNEEDELGHTALHLAAKRGRCDVAEALVSKGCVVDQHDRRGRTALHFAASEAHVECTKFLIKEGADVNAKTTAGTTALHWVAVKGCTQTATVLLDCGADVNARNNEGYTPLDRTRPADTDMAELLKAKGGISSLGWWSLRA